MQGSLRLGSCAIMLALVTTVLATISCGAADIQVLSQNDTSLSMRFTDAGNNTVDLMFTRANVNELWKASSNASGTPGIAFGNANPTYAGTAQLRALGITPPMAVQTFQIAIANRPMDDVTIVNLFDPYTAVIGLWQQGAIAEIWYVGGMVDHFLNHGLGFSCSDSLGYCCAVNDNPPEGCGEGPMPNPHVNACIAVITHCPSLKEAACDCLKAAQQYCLVPGVPPGISACCLANPWVFQLMGSASAAHTAHCDPEVPANPDGQTLAAINVLGEILDRVQVIYDTGQ